MCTVSARGCPSRSCAVRRAMISSDPSERCFTMGPNTSPNLRHSGNEVLRTFTYVGPQLNSYKRGGMARQNSQLSLYKERRERQREKLREKVNRELANFDADPITDEDDMRTAEVAYVLRNPSNSQGTLSLAIATLAIFISLGATLASLPTTLDTAWCILIVTVAIGILVCAGVGIAAGGMAKGRALAATAAAVVEARRKAGLDAAESDARNNTLARLDAIEALLRAPAPTDSECEAAAPARKYPWRFGKPRAR